MPKFRIQSADQSSTTKHIKLCHTQIQTENPRKNRSAVVVIEPEHARPPGFQRDRQPSSTWNCLPGSCGSVLYQVSGAMILGRRHYVSGWRAVHLPGRRLLAHNIMLCASPGLAEYSPCPNLSQCVRGEQVNCNHFNW